MSKLLADLVKFLWAVGGHWYTLMGVVSFFGVGVWTFLRDRPVPTFLAWALAMLLLLAAFFSAWREERTKADKLEAQNSNERGQTALRLVFKADNPTFVSDLQPGDGLGWSVRYRVGVHNAGDVTARNVSLQLVASMPGATNLPAALIQMHDKSNDPQTKWDIGPRQTQHFNVVRIPSEHVQSPTDEDQMYLEFADPVYPWMPLQPCALVLEAFGDNVATPVNGAFRIGEPRREDEKLLVDVGFEAYATAQ